MGFISGVGKFIGNAKNTGQDTVNDVKKARAESRGELANAAKRAVRGVRDGFEHKKDAVGRGLTAAETEAGAAVGHAVNGAKAFGHDVRHAGSVVASEFEHGVNKVGRGLGDAGLIVLGSGVLLTEATYHAGAAGIEFAKKAPGELKEAAVQRAAKRYASDKHLVGEAAKKVTRAFEAGASAVGNAGRAVGHDAAQLGRGAGKGLTDVGLIVLGSGVLLSEATYKAGAAGIEFAKNAKGSVTHAAAEEAAKAYAKAHRLSGDAARDVSKAFQAGTTAVKNGATAFAHDAFEKGQQAAHAVGSAATEAGHALEAARVALNSKTIAAAQDGLNLARKGGRELGQGAAKAYVDSRDWTKEQQKAFWAGYNSTQTPKQPPR